jgi:uncharacterized protein YfdQ (DUF2303 family)
VRWVTANGKRVDQVAFAAFLEDNLPDIAQPPGAQLLELARSLEVKRNVNFASSVRLDNGQTQLTYEEDVKGTAAKGTIEIPERFILGLAPFEGCAKYRLEARLRYRMAEGKLAMWFDLFRPEEVLRDAFNAVRKQIVDGTAIEPLVGTCNGGAVEE